VTTITAYTPRKDCDTSKILWSGRTFVRPFEHTFTRHVGKYTHKKVQAVLKYTKKLKRQSINDGYLKPWFRRGSRV